MSELSSPAAPAVPTATDAVSLREAFWFWLKLGFISFGGPAGQIAIMHQELVERRRWISERRFLHALNYCMVLPGPEAQQLATYIGWLMHRTWGGIVAGGLFVLPSLFILIALSWIYVRYGDVPLVAGILYGIKPAVTAIVLLAAYRIGSRALKNGWLWAIAAAAFVAIFALQLPFPVIVLGAGVDRLSSAAASRRPSSRRGGGHGGCRQALRPGRDRRRHADARRMRCSPGRDSLQVLVVGLVLWGVAIGRARALVRLGRRRSRRWAGSSPRRRC